MENKKVNKRVPKLRFKGFTDDWKQRKLGDITKIIAGGDKNKAKIKTKGKYPVIANSINTDGIIGYYDDQYRITAPAITVTGRGDIGHAKARFINFTPVVRLLALTTNHNVIFLSNTINRTRIYNESTGVPQLTKPQLANYKVFVTNKKEENNLASLLRKLQSCIVLQQQKLDQIKYLYHCYLNILIDFSSKEKLIQLKNVSRFLEKTINPRENKNTRFYEYSMPAYDNHMTARKVLGKNLHSNKFIIQEPVILFNKLNVRKRRIWNVKLIKPNSISSTEFIPIKCTNKINSQYLFFALNTDYVTCRMKSLSSGSSNSQKRIHPDDLSSLKLPIPSLKDQIKISNFLSYILSCCKNYGNQIESLRLVKNFLLQNMFI